MSDEAWPAHYGQMPTGNLVGTSEIRGLGGFFEGWSDGPLEFPFRPQMSIVTAFSWAVQFLQKIEGCLEMSVGIKAWLGRAGGTALAFGTYSAQLLAQLGFTIAVLCPDLPGSFYSVTKVPVPCMTGRTLMGTWVGLTFQTHGHSLSLLPAATLLASLPPSLRI